MNDNIVVLGTEIAEVARPQKGLIRLSKSDLYRWREIFELYLAAQVFFSTNESSGGGRNSAKAQKQLVWFQEEVTRRQLPHKFKLETSVAAYARFLELNATLLQNLQFQELNLTAVTKIIKSTCPRRCECELGVCWSVCRAVCLHHHGEKPGITLWLRRAARRLQ